MKEISFTVLTMFITIVAFGQPNKKTSAQHDFSANGKYITVYTSTADSANLKMAITDNPVFEQAQQPKEWDLCVLVTPGKTYQTILGIGGAITDASAEVFAKLPKEKQKEFLTAYYDKNKGNGYSLARTTIHSCDFSSSSYTYIAEGDKELKTFSIEHDKQFRIPLIKEAIKAAGGNLTLFASPWSPPAFMKTNKSMLVGGRLLPEFDQSWALYYTKFIEAYEKEGIPVWGITLQNEPLAQVPWESCNYTAEEERDFLKNFLGPIMKKEGLGDKKIIVWDHNRSMINFRANTIFDDPEAAKYAWGIGFHWYEAWFGGPAFNNIANVHELYPDKNLMLTEACNEGFKAAKYFYGPNAEKYGGAMINDFKNGSVAWTDWNILLDEHGGPNHVANYCFAPIHADTQTGKLIFTPTYYYIGHFSKFVRPNAKRVSTIVTRNTLISTSFLNTDGKMVTIVMNDADKKTDYFIYVGMQKAKINIPAHAIQSLVY